MTTEPFVSFTRPDYDIEEEDGFYLQSFRCKMGDKSFDVNLNYTFIYKNDDIKVKYTSYRFPINIEDFTQNYENIDEQSYKSGKFTLETFDQNDDICIINIKYAKSKQACQKFSNLIKDFIRLYESKYGKIYRDSDDYEEKVCEDCKEKTGNKVVKRSNKVEKKK